MGRGTRNKRRFVCGECGAARFVHLAELNRAARLRCLACGSARLEVSAAGAGELADRRAAGTELVDRANRRGSGSVVPGHS